MKASVAETGTSFPYVRQSSTCPSTSCRLEMYSAVSDSLLMRSTFRPSVSVSSSGGRPGTAIHHFTEVMGFGARPVYRRPTGWSAARSAIPLPASTAGYRSPGFRRRSAWLRTQNAPPDLPLRVSSNRPLLIIPYQPTPTVLRQVLCFFVCILCSTWIIPALSEYKITRPGDLTPCTHTWAS